MLDLIDKSYLCNMYVKHDLGQYPSLPSPPLTFLCPLFPYSSPSPPLLHGTTTLLQDIHA